MLILTNGHDDLNYHNDDYVGDIEDDVNDERSNLDHDYRRTLIMITDAHPFIAARMLWTSSNALVVPVVAAHTRD